MTKRPLNFVVLGAGNMGQALVVGAKAKGFPAHFQIYTPSGDKAQHLAERVAGTKLESLSALKDADLILLAFKPQQFWTAAQELKEFISSKALVISVLAGISVEQLTEGLGTQRLLRVMPNTPATIGEGLHLYYHRESFVEDQMLAPALEFLQGSGKVLKTSSEEELDLLTPFSGSGPAYLFQLAEVMEKDLEKRGFELSYARSLVVQVLKGSALYLENSDKSAGTLKQNVMSKGGITEAVIQEMENGNFAGLFSRAIDKGLARLSELKSKK